MSTSLTSSIPRNLLRFLSRGTGTCPMSRGSTVRTDGSGQDSRISQQGVNAVSNLTVSSIRSKRPAQSEQGGRVLQLAPVRSQHSEIQQGLRQHLGDQWLALTTIRGIAPSQTKRQATKDSLCSHPLFMAGAQGIIYAYTLGAVMASSNALNTNTIRYTARSIQKCVLLLSF